MLVLCSSHVDRLLLQASIRRSALQCVSLLASPSNQPTYLIAGSDAIVSGPSTVPTQASSSPSAGVVHGHTTP
jgi:hypothetical protein